VVAVDLAAVLLERARELARGLDNVTFQEADARALPFASESFDVVVFDSTLSHVPDAERSVAEASRVLRRQGWLAAFEGDYATTTVAIGDDDPLQACVDAMLATSVHDRWLVRRLPRLLRDSGLETPRLRGYSYVEHGGEYLLSIVDRGADLLVAAGRIDRGLAESLSAEARRRVSAGTFFGHIAYASAVARKPD
jgi:SAM-dependent methyltransferase